MGDARAGHALRQPMAMAVSMTVPSDERTLVERHRQGDEAAFDEIYREYEEMVFNLALRMSGNVADAEDITQEAFVRVHRYLGGFRGRSSLKTWIYRVAVNSAKNRLRGKARMLAAARFDSETELRRLPDRSPLPERRAIGSDLVGRVREALVRLPLPYRQAVLLRDFQDMSYEEIAEVLGVRMGTVRSRIARGRERLRELLEAEL